MLRWFGGNDFYFKWPPAKVQEGVTEKLITGRWYRSCITSSLLGHGFFYKRTKWTKHVSADISSLFGIFLLTNCSINKLHRAKGYCLSKYVDGTAFTRELLMVPATICYGHIHVGVCVGEQVGEALLCPSSNLLDLNQWRLGRGTVPYPS